MVTFKETLVSGYFLAWSSPKGSFLQRCSDLSTTGRRRRTRRTVFSFALMTYGENKSHIIPLRDHPMRGSRGNDVFPCLVKISGTAETNSSVLHYVNMWYNDLNINIDILSLRCRLKVLTDHSN